MSSLIRRFGLILLAAMALSGFLASGCGGDTETGEQAQFGAISGTVTLEGRDDASGVLVEAGEASATTDAAGAFTIAEVAVGEQTVRASIDGYVAQEKSIDVATDGVQVDFALELDIAPPSIDRLVVEPQTVLPEETAAARVELADDDSGELTYTWEATEGFAVEAGQEPGTAVVTAPAELDREGTVSVVVENAAGETDRAEATIRTRSNTAPVIENVSAAPAVLDRAGTATLRANAVDADGDELSYEWSAPQGWTLGAASGDEVMLTAPDAPAEAATIDVTVRDPFGAETTGSVDVTTGDNALPQITSLTAAPSQTTPNGEIELAVVGLDPDGDALEYSWSAPQGWSFDDATLDTPKLFAPDQYDDVARVSVEVTDEFGGSISGEIVVSTISNQGPQLTTVTAAPTIAARGALISLQANASHPQGEALTYTWQAPQGWALITSGNPPEAPQLQAPDEPGASATIEVTVTDTRGKRAVGSVVVQTESNNSPSINNTSATPAVVARGATSVIDVFASDPDGDALTYAWTLDNAEWSYSGSGDQITLSAPSKPDSMVTATVVVSDGFGGTASRSISVETETNQAPTINSISAPSTGWIAPGDTVTLGADATDPDGDTLTYSWSITSGWSAAGNGADVDVTAPSTSATTGTLSVTVTDSYGATATDQIDLITQDVAPNSFAFTDQTGVVANTPITSDAVVVDGFDGPLTATCSGCQVSRNAGSFAASVAGFNPGDEIRIRTTSGGPGATVTASVTLGETTSATWTLTSATKTHELFTSSGTFTVPSGVSSVRVLVVGGGGGGANGHQGGGGSGYVNVATISVTPGEAVPITVGAGGSGANECDGCNDINGNTPGEVSSFGSYLSANGGQTPTTINGPGGNGGSGGGGSCNSGTNGGDGGTGGASGGSCDYNGGSGQGDYTADLATFTELAITAGAGGAGGSSSHAAGGGGGGVFVDAAGPSAGDGPRSWSAMGGHGYGAGGGGGGYDSSTSRMRERGGDGAPGVVYVEW